MTLLDPGAGKTRKAYVWAYARGAFDPIPAVVYDFAAGRYPIEFLGRWSGTLTCDDYAGYGALLKLHARIEAEQELKARELRAGLWRDDEQVPPWEWRNRARMKDH